MRRGGYAEDLLQEIWLQIWRSLETFKSRSTLETWAYRIALNTCLGHRRAVRPAADSIDELTNTIAAPDIDDDFSLLEDFAASLNAVDRAVLLLHLDDRNADDMADIVGISPNAIAIRLTRIRKQFETRYIEE